MGQAQDMEHPGNLLFTQHPAGSMGPVAVAQLGNTLGLVQGHVLFDPALEPLRNDPGIAAESIHNVPVQPAALVLQSSGQIPVVKGNHGLDAVGQQFFHQIVIELQALLVNLAVAVGNHPGPADGEAVGLNVVGLHQGHILPEPMVAVAGHVAGVALDNMLRCQVMAEFVPNIRALAVGVPAALALVGSTGNAPDKFFRKAHKILRVINVSLEFEVWSERGSVIR